MEDRLTTAESHAGHTAQRVVLRFDERSLQSLDDIAKRGPAVMPPIEYRDFVIVFDPPPIGTRVADWQWSHKDYDGPEDNRLGHSPTLEKAKADIDEMIELLEDQ